MDEQTMDVIVVGAGIAGCVTAIELARAGRDVVLVERGRTPGDKNLSGGVLYCHGMIDLFPDFLDIAPYERVITRNTVAFLNTDSMVSVDYRDDKLGTQANAVSVLRAPFDAWLAEQAEAEGVMVMPETKVDGLMMDGKRVTGVSIGEDDVPARVVVIADGVNSFLAREAGLRRDQHRDELAVGVKSVWKLDEHTINDRFNVASGEGAAYAIVGDATRGVGGGGFLYTNKDTISAGVVLRLDSLVDHSESSAHIHDYFVTHPQLAPLLADAQMIEYGCHMVNEGGKDMVEPLVVDGAVIVGDAAGLTLNTGLTIRGMDLAVASARAAADGILEAFEVDDMSADGLAGYPRALWASPEGQDLHTYRTTPEFMLNERLYNDYGPLLADIMYRTYRLDGTPRQHLATTAATAVKDSPVGVVDLARDGWKAMRSL